MLMSEMLDRERPKLADLFAEFSRTKEQFARLGKDRDDFYQRRRATLDSLERRPPDDASQRTYQRTKTLFQAISRNLAARHIALAHQIEYLRGCIAAEKQLGTLGGLFAKFSSQQTGYQNHYLHAIGRMIDAADAGLEYPAADAITAFVGHAYSSSPEGGAVGIMQEKRLEDAYAPTPSERGRLIRQQLTTAFAPIRAALQQTFGAALTLHRAQGPATRTRYVMSYTGTLSIADLFRVGDREVHTKIIPLDRIIWITDRANQQEFIVKAN